MLDWTLKSSLSEKRSLVLCIMTGFTLMIALMATSFVHQTYAQMMNPNMTMNRNMILPNGTFINTEAMLNGSWMNPMFQQGHNITGSINLMSTMFNSIASQVNVTLSDAAVTAQKQTGNNSRVVSAHLDVVNGYLTYIVCTIDSEMNLHSLIIDAGTGKVLSSLKLPLQNMVFGGMMNPNMMGSMMNPNMMGSMMNPNMMGNMMGVR